MRLSQKQLAQYRERGFAGPNPILSKEQLERLRREMDTLIEALPPGQRPEYMPSPHYENEYIRELLLSDPFVDVAEQILGPDVALFTVVAISKKPEDGLPVDWHQDAPYFPIDPVETFTLWLAVDDSDRDNGCMRVLPGTHQPRRLKEHGVSKDGGSALPQSLTGLDTTGAKDLEVPAGHYTVHDAFILHGSNPNRGPPAGAAALRSNMCRPTSSWTGPTGPLRVSTGRTSDFTWPEETPATSPTSLLPNSMSRREKLDLARIEEGCK